MSLFILIIGDETGMNSKTYFQRACGSDDIRDLGKLSRKWHTPTQLSSSVQLVFQH